MRVLFSTTAGAGHFGPMIPIAKAGSAAGWDVAVAAPNGFADVVQRAGLEHVPFGEPSPARLQAVFGGLTEASGAEADRIVIAEVFGRLDAQAALPGLTELVRTWAPDLVLRDPTEFGSLAAAEAAGIPHVEVSIGMARLGPAVRAIIADPLRELESIAGLPVGRLAQGHAERATVTSVPESLDASDADLLTRSHSGKVQPDPGPLWRYRTEPTAAATLPPPWGDPDAPLVYATFGSVLSGVRPTADLFRSTLASLADLPVRVLLTTGAAFDPADLEPLPANACVEPWWPQGDVMPATAAMIGHGGFGTTMAGLVAGVPQVVVPLFAGDQHQHAAQISAKGAGVVVAEADVAAALPDAVMRLLTEPQFRARARGLADEIAQLPDITECLHKLESFAARGGD